MSSSHTIFRVALVASLLAPVNACSDGAGTSESSMTVLLTDAPGDMRAAVVTIDEIYLQGQGGRVVLMNEPATVNLLDLANEAVTLVADAPVPGARYTQLRFVISDAYIEVENESGGSDWYATSADYAALPPGATLAGTLQTPSWDASGLKVDLPNAALDFSGEERIVLLDFDVHQSFGREAGGSGQWVMSPIIRGAEIGVTGSVTVDAALGAGVVLPDVEGTPATLADVEAVLVDAFGGETPLLLQDTDGDGVHSAAFQYLLPGGYAVFLRAPAGITLTTDPASSAAAPHAMAVSGGDGAAVTFTVTAAQ